jgi:DNA-binding NarL/FixJ family response regulator
VSIAAGGIGASSSAPRSTQGVRPRVLIADDHPILRGAFGKLLTNAGYDVVAEAADGEEAVRLALSERPDVVLLDRVMPRGGGLEAAKRIAAAAPEIRVVVISGHIDDEALEEARAAGAAGFIAKTATWSQLAAILEAVLAGRAQRESDGTTFDRSATSVDPWDPITADRLTPREQEVLRLVTEGHTSGSVAAILRVSPRTVETHRQHIMTKLGIHSVAGLTRFALEKGRR